VVERSRLHSQRDCYLPVCSAVVLAAGDVAVFFLRLVVKHSYFYVFTDNIDQFFCLVPQS